MRPKSNPKSSKKKSVTIDLEKAVEHFLKVGFSKAQIKSMRERAEAISEALDRSRRAPRKIIRFDI